MKVSLDRVRVQFGEVQALAGVSVTLDPGEVTVLLGPNGAGKSTLLGVLLGLVTPDAGSAKVDGQSVRSRSFKSRLGYLPEAVAFAENLSGRQVMRFFARAKGVDRQNMEAVLDQVGLLHAAGRPVRGYSRGMRQRLGIGVAILGRPELLVLDEPTGGLDQEGLELLWSILEEWKEAGRTVVVSTHDVALIERRADQVVILSKGSVKAAGSPTELRERAALPVQVHLAWNDAQAAQAAADHFEETGRPTQREGHRVSVSVDALGLFSVLKDMNGQSKGVTTMRVEEPGLDDVYNTLLEAPTWDESEPHS